MTLTSNRITGFLDPEPTAQVSRTEAQREAAHRNGARSRGPVTEQGKAGSRLNSVKHGLFARNVMPPADAREHDRLYREARDGLIREYKPASYSKKLLVDSLASDIVSLARARRMIEKMQRPVLPPTHADASSWDRFVKARRECRLLRNCIKRLDAGKAACGRRIDADRIAVLLANWVQEAGEVVADAAAEIENDPTSPSQDLENLSRCRALLKSLGKLRKPFADATHLANVLSGGTNVASAERCLRTLIDHAYQVKLRWLRERRSGNHQLLKPYDDALATTARSTVAVEQLLLLDRYRANIESAIARKLRQLGRD